MGAKSKITMNRIVGKGGRDSTEPRYGFVQDGSKSLKKFHKIALYFWNFIT